MKDKWLFNRYRYQLNKVLDDIACTIKTLLCKFPEVAEVTITANPEAVCGSGNVVLTAVVTGCDNTYQWQILEGGSYANIEEETLLTLTRNIVSTTSFRLEVTQCNGNIVYSDPIEIIVSESSVLLYDSAEYNDICGGGTTILHGEIIGCVGEPTFQWESSLDGIVWTPIPGATSIDYLTQVLTNPNTPLIDEDCADVLYYYRLIGTCNGCSAISYPGQIITVHCDPLVFISAEEYNVCVDAEYITHSEVIGGTGISTYQWQVFIDGVWTNIAFGEGADVISSFSEAGEYEIRLIVNQNSGCQVISDSLTITVLEQPEVTITADDETICSDSILSITSVASGGIGPLSYWWEYEISPGVWSNTGIDTPDYVVDLYADPIYGVGTHTFRLNVFTAGNCNVYSNEVTITVSNTGGCFGNITGSVLTTFGEPIAGVNVRLYEDFDADGVADNATIIRSIFTNSSGNLAMASLAPGHYVIVCTPPAGYTLVSGIDSSDDGDLVPNTPTTDNIIPVTVRSGEVDIDNVFIWESAPGNITGYVFVDSDLDQLPDIGEGFAGATVELYEDIDIDGVADASLIATTTTDANGFYQFLNISTSTYAGRKRHCVLKLIIPDGYQIVRGYDFSGDGDNVTNTPDTDIYIPVTLFNSETDNNNYFIIAPTP